MLQCFYVTTWAWWRHCICLFLSPERKIDLDDFCITLSMSRITTQYDKTSTKLDYYGLKKYFHASKIFSCNIEMSVNEKENNKCYQIINYQIENPIFYKRYNDHKDICFFEQLMMIICLLSIVNVYLILYICFGRIKLMLGMLVTWKRKQYLCNMIFFDKTKAHCIYDGNGFWNVFWRLCYIITCTLSPLVVSCLLEPVLSFKNVGDLVRNLSTQTFHSSRASSASFRMIPTRSD